MTRRELLLAGIGALTLPLSAYGLSHIEETIPTQKQTPGASDTFRRKELAGWILLQLSGTPAELGYQHGSLAAAEFSDAWAALRLTLKHQTGYDWTFFRDTCYRLYNSRLEAEIRSELEGIAEGLRSQGVKADFRDLLAYNSWIETAFYYLPSQSARLSRLSGQHTPRACSAFIATGSATHDGRLVMGHNFWWDYLLGQRWRFILDIQPDHGHRLVMDALPGMVHSGTDFCITDAGIVFCETTIAGFHGFDPKGSPEFQRIRLAAQRADNLDEFSMKLMLENNGGYANTWLAGDIKSGHIQKLELGLKNVTLTRTDDGYYYGANFPENETLLAKECEPGVEKEPSLVRRRKRWQRLMKENNGRIDAALARSFLADTRDEVSGQKGATENTLCGRGDLTSSKQLHGAVSARVVTAEGAKSLSFEARLGFPDGSSFNASEFLEANPGETWQRSLLRNIQPHPWTTIQTSTTEAKAVTGAE